ncbi:sugar ABC transporter substrate-binding protein [Microbacterium pygmaeum]|uniref:Monosaccharide ABC transporter substrate-binding protein, CUT2 family n=1 Tax=Microbacterium pygmaeum TaxID=370764 RepID=A0A1G7W8C4_9MICO|nr:substrate-binding domain-containing protein [Microbacterium pygmaeum]SDG68255.1 monosaccharide ABC transporter substrate-binding protein, CUT2 family [Microbacterium pygmaeum]
MTRSHAVSRRTGSSVVALGVAAALLLSGCSTDAPADPGTDAPAADAVSQEVLDKLASYEAASALDNVGEAFDVSSVEGKTVWWVIQEGANPFLATVMAHAEEALAEVGVKLVTCDGKSNPVDANNCITQGIAQGAAAIQVDGPDPETVANAAQAAVDAGIPVLTGSGIDASQPMPDFIAGVTSQPYVLTGELAADWIIADSDGAANVLFITTPDVSGSGFQAQGFKDEMAKYCPDCTVTEQGVTLGNWASDLGSTVSAALAKDPTINYIAPVFDPMTQFINPAIQQAGRGEDVQVVTVNGNLPFMQELATGTGPTKALVGLDLNLLGWIEADQILRVLTDTPPVSDYYTVARVFDEDNIGELDLTAEAFGDSSWYGGAGSTAELFTSLWLK